MLQTVTRSTSRTTTHAPAKRTRKPASTPYPLLSPEDRAIVDAAWAEMHISSFAELQPGDQVYGFTLLGASKGAYATVVDVKADSAVVRLPDGTTCVKRMGIMFAGKRHRLTGESQEIHHFPLTWWDYADARTRALAGLPIRPARFNDRTTN
jgi:hypothetical protein